MLSSRPSPSRARRETHRATPLLSLVQAQHREDVQGANTVTKEFLQLSQPYIHEGALLSSSVSGRRLYLHHLSDLPLSEVYSTLEGNILQRADKVRVCVCACAAARPSRFSNASKKRLASLSRACVLVLFTAQGDARWD